MYAVGRCQDVRTYRTGTVGGKTVRHVQVPLAGEGRERRYYAVPDDRAVKVGASMWQSEMPLGAAFELVSSALEVTTRISISVWHGHTVATLYTTDLYPEDHVQAVSGWGDNASEAMLELAYRWVVLMGRSWFICDHVVRKHCRDAVTRRVNAAIEGLR